MKLLEYLPISEPSTKFCLMLVAIVIFQTCWGQDNYSVCKGGQRKLVELVETYRKTKELDRDSCFLKFYKPFIDIEFSDYKRTSSSFNHKGAKENLKRIKSISKKLPRTLKDSVKAYAITYLNSKTLESIQNLEANHSFTRDVSNSWYLISCIENESVIDSSLLRDSLTNRLNLLYSKSTITEVHYLTDPNVWVDDKERPYLNEKEQGQLLKNRLQKNIHHQLDMLFSEIDAKEFQQSIDKYKSILNYLQRNFQTKIVDQDWEERLNQNFDKYLMDNCVKILRDTSSAIFKEVIILNEFLNLSKKKFPSFTKKWPSALDSYSTSLIDHIQNTTFNKVGDNTITSFRQSYNSSSKMKRIPQNGEFPEGILNAIKKFEENYQNINRLNKAIEDDLKNKTTENTLKWISNLMKIGTQKSNKNQEIVAEKIKEGKLAIQHMEDFYWIIREYQNGYLSEDSYKNELKRRLNTGETIHDQIRKEIELKLK